MVSADNAALEVRVREGTVTIESGKQLLFDSSEARNTASNTTMHGSVDLEPMLSLDLVLQTTELLWHEQDGFILLSVND